MSEVASFFVHLRFEVPFANRDDLEARTENLLRELADEGLLFGLGHLRAGTLGVSFFICEMNEEQAFIEQVEGQIQAAWPGAKRIDYKDIEHLKLKQSA